MRISLADITDLDNVRYRHMLLVEPLLRDGAVDIGPVQVHAGGIVWFGDYLYVVDTFHGIRVFDLTRIIRVSHADDTSRIGSPRIAWTPMAIATPSP